MSSPIIIQINNIKALERLLGNGEDNFEMAVRNSVAQVFANRHFNALERTPEVQEAIQEAKQRGEAIRAESKKQMELAIGQELGVFTKSSYYPYELTFSLSDDIKSRIKGQAIAAAQDLVIAEVKRVVAEYDLPKLISECVAQKIDSVWVANIDTEVNKRLTEIKKLI